MKFLQLGAVVLLCVLVFTAPGFSQFIKGGNIVLVDASMISVKGEETENTLSGYSIGVGIEQSTFGGSWAGGVQIFYLHAEETTDPRDVNISYSTIPILLFGKFMFGGEKFRGYLMGGAGLQFSTRDINNDVTGTISTKDSGITLSAGAGGYAFLDEKFVLHLNYKFMWLENGYYSSGYVHQVGLGLGFQSL